MTPKTFLEICRDLVGRIGFRAFLWANRTTPEDYWNEIYIQERNHLAREAETP